MTTREELNASFDRLSEKVLRMKAERDELLAVAKQIQAAVANLAELLQTIIAKAEGE